MSTISPVEIFIALFIGMGPIKVLLVYIAMTEGLSRETKRRVAKRTVLVAGVVGLGLFLLGAVLQAILHFSIGSLTIFGGLILLILALTMVIGGQKTAPQGQDQVDPLSMAVSPLAIPLTLNPVGVVILMVASVEVQDLGLGIAMIVMILVIMGIDLVVLYGSDGLAKHLSQATVELLERVHNVRLSRPKQLPTL
jgi:small neutral amino acid transporter SnatA (MarC family)